MNLDFYKNKKVLITGHTGFKGSWMCKVLINAGAEVTGYALAAPTNPSLFEMCNLSSQVNWYSCFAINGIRQWLELLVTGLHGLTKMMVVHMKLIFLSLIVVN